MAAAAAGGAAVQLLAADAPLHTVHKGRPPRRLEAAGGEREWAESRSRGERVRVCQTL